MNWAAIVAFAIVIILLIAAAYFAMGGIIDGTR